MSNYDFLQVAETKGKQLVKGKNLKCCYFLQIALFAWETGFYWLPRQTKRVKLLALTEMTNFDFFSKIKAKKLEF